MCLIMAIAAVVALFGLRPGVQEEAVQTADQTGSQLPETESVT